MNRIKNLKETNEVSRVQVQLMKPFACAFLVSIDKRPAKTAIAVGHPSNVQITRQTYKFPRVRVERMDERVLAVKSCTTVKIMCP